MISAVMLNGRFVPELSDLSLLPAGVSASEKDGTFVLTLPDNCQIAQPVKLIYQSDGKTNDITAQQLITVGSESKLTLLDEFNGDVTEAIYNIDTRIIQRKDSSVSLVCLKNGAKLAKNTIHVLLAEKGAECKTAGFYHVNENNQEINYHLTIEHAAPHTTSDMLFKGIAENKSRATFVGRLHVHPHAQKITAQQANHNLLLTRDAEISSKPELEIYADDVKCKHGATTGQLDQDALFYLRARGIPEQEAKQLLVEGFAEEIVARTRSLCAGAEFIEVVFPVHEERVRATSTSRTEL